jgi:FHS family glucose/mannose:H+ symporter-like MFS transporter
MKKLLWLGCLSYLVIGVAHVVGGSILEQMMEHYGLAYKDGGQWIMNQFIGFLVGVLLAPSITARIGKRGAVLLAIGLLTISEAAYSLLLPWGWMLAVAPLAGFGFGMTEAIVGAMIIDLVKDGKASAMSRLETFFGLGALLIPLGAAYLIQQQAWQAAFPILAALAAITFMLWLTLSFGEEADEQIGFRLKADRSQNTAKTRGVAEPLTAKLSSSSAFFGYPRRALPFLLLSALFFMLYVGMEMSFSNYLPSILIEKSGVGEANAAAALSLFWGAMVAGRLFAGVLADRLGYVRYLLLAMIGATLVFVLLAAVGTLSWMLVLIALSGLFFSGVFGIALVYANALIPGMTERTTSLLVACGGLGGAIFPRVTGWFMDRYAAGTTLWYIGVQVLAILLLLLLMVAFGRRQPSMSGIDAGQA